MLPIKNSLKSCLRTPGKTLVFTVVLSAVTVLLSVSFCVYAAARGYLRDAEEYFHTIAELEYLGEQYPERDVYDPAVWAAVEENWEALEALLADEAVLAFEPDTPALGFIEGLHRIDRSVYNTRQAVIGVRIMSFDERTRTYTAIVSREYYSLQSYYEKLITVTFYDPDEPLRGTADGTPVFLWDAPELEVNRRYVLSGYFVSGRTAAACFVPEEIPFEDETGTAVTVGWAETEDYELPEDSDFLRLARVLHLQNDGCRVSYTSAIEDTLPFHQQQTQLTEGRLFTEAEYAARAEVCILSQSLAGKLGIEAGDRISMEVFTSAGDLYDPAALAPAEAGDYEVVGVCTEAESCPFQVWLPGAKETGLGPVTGYTLGRLRLDNEKTSAFLRRAEALESRGFRVSVYDQGYAAATEPIRELLFIAVLFLAVCLLLAAVALSLQSRLFVSRQRETARTMEALGSGQAHIRVYFLSAAVLLTVCAAGAGCGIARWIEGRVLALLRRLVSQFAAQDTRFSFSRLALVRSLDFDPYPSLTVYLAAAGTLLFGTVLFTLIFTRSVRKDGKARRSAPGGKRRAAPGRGKTSRLSGPLKYALLSLIRSRARTAAALLLCAAAAGFFCRLTASLDSYEAQRNRYQAEAVIRGYGTDYYGRRIDRLSLRPEPILRLLESGLIEDANLTKSIGCCTVLGVAVTAEGVRQMEPYKKPKTKYELESLYLDACRNGLWVSTSSVCGSPQFHHRAASDITWLEGYDERSFLQIWPICALSAGLMREKGIHLGDSVLILSPIASGNSIHFRQAVLKVVACYASETASKTVFSPLNTGFAFTEDPFEAYEMLESFQVRYPVEGSDEILSWKLEALNEEDLQWVRYSSFTFTLRDASRLDALREALAVAGFTWVNSGDRVHNFAMLEDEMYLNTVHSMERQIQYMGALYGSLYLAAGAVGATLAWLLILSRRREIALMRALGTQPLRLLGNFFLEQALLCAFGLGLGLWLAGFLAPVSGLAVILCASFFGVWCAASLLCLAAGLRRRAQAALTEPE